MSTTRIIGIDVATMPSKVGLALADYDGGSLNIGEVTLCSDALPPASVVANWIRKSPSRVLLAIDAPLGWPTDLSSALSTHRAGEPLPISAALLFRRDTDRDVQRRTGKTPLDVGADRIARTAHSALSLLSSLREAVGPVPLAWTRAFHGTAAIEVYPSATLKVRGWPSTKYKKPEQRTERQVIVDHIRRSATLSPDDGSLLAYCDVLDAAICVLAGVDFLECRAAAPVNHELAAREGWIWVADPSPSGILKTP